MKQGVAIILFFSFFSSCKNSEAPKETPLPEISREEPLDLFVGNWNMDSSVFISNGERGEVSAPLMPTTWIFEKSGAYTVQNSVQMPGTYSHVGDSLFVVLMGVPNEYEILTINETNLLLRSTIIETETSSMKTEAYLTRIKK